MTVTEFPMAKNRPTHIYELENCSGCQKKLNKDQFYTEVVMTNKHGMEKKHIALCEDCLAVAEGYGVL